MFLFCLTLSNSSLSCRMKAKLFSMACKVLHTPALVTALMSFPITVPFIYTLQAIIYTLQAILAPWLYLFTLGMFPPEGLCPEGSSPRCSQA